MRLGQREYDCKYVFVLLCYRFFDESVDESLGELFGEEQATIIYAEE